jgi:hypothetical protein
MPIFQPSARTSSSISSGASPDRDSTDDYPEIKGSICWNLAEEGRLIIMVAMIDRSKMSDARTPKDRMIRNLNPDFNVVRLQIIMETIQHMAPEGSPLDALA